MFKVFKPKGTLKKGDTDKTKIEIASEIITELVEFGFNIELVLLAGWIFILRIFARFYYSQEDSGESSRNISISPETLKIP